MLRTYLHMASWSTSSMNGLWVFSVWSTIYLSAPIWWYVIWLIFNMAMKNQKLATLPLFFASFDHNFEYPKCTRRRSISFVICKGKKPVFEAWMILEKNKFRKTGILKWKTANRDWKIPWVRVELEDTCLD